MKWKAIQLVSVAGDEVSIRGESEERFDYGNDVWWSVMLLCEEGDATR